MFFPENNPFSEERGTECGTVGAQAVEISEELASVIRAWETIGVDDRRQVMELTGQTAGAQLSPSAKRRCGNVWPLARSPEIEPDGAGGLGGPVRDMRSEHDQENDLRFVVHRVSE